MSQIGLLRAPWRILIGMALITELSGCGSAPPPAVAKPKTSKRARGPQLNVHGEVGAMDEGAVREVFAEALEDLNHCVESNRERIPFIAGEVEVYVRVANDGTVRFAYLRASELGDWVTERCIVDQLGKRRWPKPKGGEEGFVVQRLDLGGSMVDRATSELAPSDLGRDLDKPLAELRSCRRDAGTGPVEVTMYIDPNGKTMGSGMGFADERGLQVAECMIAVIDKALFPSPGSYPAKVIIRVE